jgi:hypothetical protein
VRTLTERNRNRILAKQVRNAEATAAHRLIAEALPSHVMAITGPEELEGMRRLIALPLRGRPLLMRDDYRSAAGIFLLGVLATFPIAVPFIVTTDASLAMRASQLLTLAMLFATGFALARHPGPRAPRENRSVDHVPGGRIDRSSQGARRMSRPARHAVISTVMTVVMCASGRSAEIASEAKPKLAGNITGFYYAMRSVRFWRGRGIDQSWIAACRAAQ